MELALKELKTQAKKLLKAVKLDSDMLLKNETPLKELDLSLIDELKLKQCLTIVSQQLGFRNWHHAQDVLSGKIKNIENLNMGTFFYPQGADGFINEWFANYQQAKSTLSAQAGEKWILPYKNQFIVVKKDYILAFKLNEKSTMLWSVIDHNMVDSYKSEAWDKIALEIIRNRTKNY